MSAFVSLLICPNQRLRHIQPAVSNLSVDVMRLYELDLSGLENATAGDLAQAAKITSKKHRGLNPATLEMATEYAATIGHLMTKLPLEFFERMPAKDAIALKGLVVGFLFNADGEE